MKYQWIALCLLLSILLLCTACSRRPSGGGEIHIPETTGSTTAPTISPSASADPDGAVVAVRGNIILSRRGMQKTEFFFYDAATGATEAFSPIDGYGRVCGADANSLWILTDPSGASREVVHYDINAMAAQTSLSLNGEIGSVCVVDNRLYYTKRDANGETHDFSVYSMNLRGEETEIIRHTSTPLSVVNGKLYYIQDGVICESDLYGNVRVAIANYSDTYFAIDDDDPADMGVIGDTLYLHWKGQETTEVIGLNNKTVLFTLQEPLVTDDFVVIGKDIYMSREAEQGGLCRIHTATGEIEVVSERYATDLYEQGGILYFAAFDGFSPETGEPILPERVYVFSTDTNKASVIVR